MDLDLYSAVVAGRGDTSQQPDREPRSVLCDRIFRIDQYEPGELRLRQDMAGMKVVWYNSLSRDWWAFFRNNNPLLACCASHKLHVISRSQRIWVNVMLVMLAIHLAITSTEAQQCAVYDMSSCRAPELTNHTQESHWNQSDQQDSMRDYYAARGREAPPEVLCCGLDRFGLVTIYEKWGSIGLSMMLSVGSIVASFLWFQCAACGCVQDKSVSTRTRGERAGKVVLCVCTAMLAGPTPYYLSYVIQNETLEQFLINFAITKCTGLAVISFLQTSVFYFLWRCQKSDSAIRDWGCCWCKRYYIEYAQLDAQQAAAEVCGCDISGQELAMDAARDGSHASGHSIATQSVNELEAMQLVTTASE